MLTREQKASQVKEITAKIQNNSLLLVNFSGLKVEELSQLRQILREKNAQFQVFKKRLLKLAFQGSGISLDPTEFGAQTAIIFVPQDILSVAGDVYRFSRQVQAEGKLFQVLAGYDFQENKLISAKEFTVLASLPSREVLLAQLAVMLTMPLRQLAYSLTQIKKD